MNKKEIRIVAKESLPLITQQITKGKNKLISDEGIDDNIEHFGKIQGEQYSVGYSFYKNKNNKLYSISYRLFLAVEEI